MSKYSILFRTEHPNDRISEAVLASTDSRDRASMLKLRVLAAAGNVPNRRSSKKVRVIKVDIDRYRVFQPTGNGPAKNQVFNSIDELAAVIGANPVTLRAEICKVKAGRKTEATVRGVTYAYAA